MGAARSALGRRSAPLALALVFSIAGCTVTPEKKADTINAINRAFQVEYEAILKEKGTRVFGGVSRDEAFAATRTTLLNLGMQIIDQDPTLGYLSARASAPNPLDSQEWRQAAEADLPKARAIIREHLGPVPALLFTFEPEGLDNVLNVTIIETRAGAEISITMRMRETAPPKGDLPRREYPPPTGMRIGLDKFWSRLEQTLRAAPGRR